MNHAPIKFVVCVYLACVASTTAAQTYPAKPLRLIVPFVPGGANDIIQRLNAALNKALAIPSVLERFASQGAEARPGTSEDLGKFVREDMAKWKKVVQQAKLQAD